MLQIYRACDDCANDCVSWLVHLQNDCEVLRDQLDNSSYVSMSGEHTLSQSIVFRGTEFKTLAFYDILFFLVFPNLCFQVTSLHTDGNNTLVSIFGIKRLKTFIVLSISYTSYADSRVVFFLKYVNSFAIKHLFFGCGGGRGNESRGIGLKRRKIYSWLCYLVARR